MLMVSMLVGITLGLPGKVHNQHAVLEVDATVAKSSDRVTYTNSGGGFAAMCAIEATPCASSRNRLCRDHQPV